MLGVLGACNVTWLLLGVMLLWTVLLTPATFARLIGLPLGRLLLLALRISTGGCFSPALGGRVNDVPITFFWPGCSELVTCDHIAWSCPCQPIPPKPGEFLSSRFGWVVTDQAVDIVAVQARLVPVQKSII